MIFKPGRYIGSEQGQVILGAIVLLVILAIILPAIILRVQNESKWTVKNEESTTAFHLAESGVDQGYQQILASTTTWSNVISGTIPSGFNFDQIYNDTYGQYAIRLKAVSGAVFQEIAVTGVGRDNSTHELRAVQAVYEKAGLGNTAIYAVSSYSMSANPDVEWGAVVCPGPITTGGQNYPMFISANSISPWKTTNTPPVTDNVQWWAYQTVPPTPQIDLTTYKSEAQAQGNYDSSSNCGISLSALSSFVGYCEGNYTTGPNVFFKGSLIILGNLTLVGSYGSQNVIASVPQLAWEQYGNNWSHYQSFDGSAPSTYASAKSQSYVSVSTLTYTVNGAFMDGFLYVGGRISINGGGNSPMVGALYAHDVGDLGTSHVKFYYDNNVAQSVLVKNNTPSRVSWQDVSGCSWTGTYPTCP